MIRRWIAICLTLAAWPLLAAGYLLPLVELKKLLFFSETPSLMSIIAGLSLKKDYFLASVLLVFTVFFPVAKLTLLSGAFLSQPHTLPLQLKLLARLGKWSMLDVLILAIGIFAAHRSGLSAATSQPGAWCFAASVLASALAAEIIAMEAQTET